MADRTGSPTTDRRRLFADRYALGAVLGRGGMADVYRAEDVLLGRAVAVKIFRPTEPIVTDTRRIESEIRTLASLTHPGLVTLFDAGTALDAPAGTAPNAEGVVVGDLEIVEIDESDLERAIQENGELDTASIRNLGAWLPYATLSGLGSVGMIAGLERFLSQGSRPLMHQSDVYAGPVLALGGGFLFLIASYYLYRALTRQY